MHFKDTSGPRRLNPGSAGIPPPRSRCGWSLTGGHRICGGRDVRGPRGCRTRFATGWPRRVGRTAMVAHATVAGGPRHCQLQSHMRLEMPRGPPATIRFAHWSRSGTTLHGDWNCSANRVLHPTQGARHLIGTTFTRRTTKTRRVGWKTIPNLAGDAVGGRRDEVQSFASGCMLRRGRQDGITCPPSGPGRAHRARPPTLPQEAINLSTYGRRQRASTDLLAAPVASRPEGRRQASPARRPRFRYPTPRGSPPPDRHLLHERRTPFFCESAECSSSRWGAPRMRVAWQKTT